MVKVLRITSARPGFRRAGIAHPAEPTSYPLDFFSDAQLEALRNEPMLTVEQVDADEMTPIISGKADAPIIALASGLLQIPLGGEKSIKLADLVALTLHQSKLSLADWNLLSDAARAEHLQPALNDAVSEQLHAMATSSGPGPGIVKDDAQATGEPTPPPEPENEPDTDAGTSTDIGKKQPPPGKANGKK